MRASFLAPFDCLPPGAAVAVAVAAVAAAAMIESNRRVPRPPLTTPHERAQQTARSRGRVQQISRGVQQPAAPGGNVTQTSRRRPYSNVFFARFSRATLSGHTFIQQTDLGRQRELKTRQAQKSVCSRSGRHVSHAYNSAFARALGRLRVSCLHGGTICLQACPFARCCR